MTFRQVRQISAVIFWITVGLVIVSLLCAQLFPQVPHVTLTAWILAAVAAVADAVFLTRWWRCPHCGKSLPAAGVSIMAPTLAYCPHCGHPLHDDDMIS